MLAEIDCVIFDCDGVIWRGTKLIKGADDTIATLRSLGKRLFFLSNNSTKSRIELIKRFFDSGIQINLSELINSAYLLASWLTNMRIPPTKCIYVIGRHGIMDELRQQGISCFGGPEEDGESSPFPFMHPSIPRELIAAVVVGFDQRFNYTKLVKAKYYLDDLSVMFIATNTDSTYPDDDHEFPGTGCIVAAVEKATSRKALVIGKPSALAWGALQAAHPELETSRTLTVSYTHLTLPTKRIV